MSESDFRDAAPRTTVDTFKRARIVIDVEDDGGSAVHTLAEAAGYWADAEGTLVADEMRTIDLSNPGVPNSVARAVETLRNYVHSRGIARAQRLRGAGS